MLTQQLVLLNTGLNVHLCRLKFKNCPKFSHPNPELLILKHIFVLLKCYLEKLHNISTTVTFPIWHRKPGSVKDFCPLFCGCKIYWVVNQISSFLSSWLAWPLLIDSETGEKESLLERWSSPSWKERRETMIKQAKNDLLPGDCAIVLPHWKLKSPTNIFQRVK